MDIHEIIDAFVELLFPCLIQACLKVQSILIKGNVFLSKNVNDVTLWRPQIKLVLSFLFICFVL